MTSPAVLAATESMTTSVANRAVAELLAFGDELGEIAITIAVAIESTNGEPSAVATAIQLRHAAAALRQHLDQILDQLRTV